MLLPRKAKTAEFLITRAWLLLYAKMHEPLKQTARGSGE